MNAARLTLAFLLLAVLAFAGLYDTIVGHFDPLLSALEGPR